MQVFAPRFSLREFPSVVIAAITKLFRLVGSLRSQHPVHIYRKRNSGRAMTREDSKHIRTGGKHKKNRKTFFLAAGFSIGSRYFLFFSSMLVDNRECRQNIDREIWSKFERTKQEKSITILFRRTIRINVCIFTIYCTTVYSLLSFRYTYPPSIYRG